MRNRKLPAFIGAVALVLVSCGGGGGSTGGGSSGGGSSGGGVTPPATPVYTIPAQESLSVADVQSVLARAIEEASARSLPATIAVVDRVGNVLAVFNMTGARATALTSPAGNGASVDAQNVTVPAAAGAIAKAVTGAYLSSGGNAFSTRTASQIVQEHFPAGPSTAGLESGPLFGVQFSQLPCSDLNARFGQAMVGPKRSPLGLAADAGGLPLYKNGVLVGAIGVMADGDYGFDRNTLDVDNDDEEFIALAGTTDFAAPDAIRANRITVDGTSLRFSDATPAGLRAQAAPRAFAALNGTLGALIAVTGYADAVVIAGTAYGTEASGIRKATTAEFSNVDAFLLTNGSGAARFPVRAGTDSELTSPLTAAESRTVLEEAFKIMARARAQIRQPLDSRAQVTISLVDTRGAVLGQVRSPDAPVFGIDVSLQKARTAAFFSNMRAATDLLAAGDANVTNFVPAYRTFLGNAAALGGADAISNRWIGLLARPYFPDGQLNTANGPLSRPIAQFNPFSTGLQSALIIGNLGAHLGFVTGASGTDTPQRCTTLPDVVAGQNRLQNGIQIFPGAVPIYRGTTLVGAIGVSGDGIDQDDMISFLGLHNAGAKIGGIGHAATSFRADRIPFAQANNATLPYVQCPFAPFLDTNDQNVCQGK
jgi:uncharacterized protein GlcG (DUF336 family)